MANKDVFSQPQAATLTHDEAPSGLQGISDDRAFFGHPRGLATLFFMEMWERFSYYGIRPLLVLVMTAALMSGGLGLTRETASAITGIYAASVYLSSLPGGWIADRWLGLQRAIWYGGVFIALGHLSIALSAVLSSKMFFLGLILIIIGTGLLKPNISALVGDLYTDRGARRDAGFSIFYMGINLGAFIAPFFSGPLGERVGWHLGFGAAGLGMLIGLITFRIRAGTTLGPLGSAASGSASDQKRARTVAPALGAVAAGVGFLLMVAAANHVIAGGTGARVAMWWLIGSYLLQVWGELALSPVGLSAMTTLAPRRIVGQMMGVWFTSISLGNLIAGLIGGNVDPEKLNEMPALFQRTAVSLFVAAAVLLVLLIPISRMMRKRAAES